MDRNTTSSMSRMKFNSLAYNMATVQVGSAISCDWAAYSIVLLDARFEKPNGTSVWGMLGTPCHYHDLLSRCQMREMLLATIKYILPWPPMDHTLSFCPRHRKLCGSARSSSWDTRFSSPTWTLRSSGTRSPGLCARSRARTWPSAPSSAPHGPRSLGTTSGDA